ncbi:KPRS4-like protein [Mya arenaria]|uniref:KPRS4-like protein n=1 Tax=Mya arenaria TaxID=6604 RepID=A0ABY7F9L6_MYAAR|nr:KPRS4-like protein [Mya arenaria]
MANPNEPVLLYAHPTMRTLAKQIALQCSLRAKMGTDSHPPETLNIPQQSPEKKPKLSFHRSLSRGNLLPGSRCVEYRDTIRWEKFQDGFPNLFIEDVHLIFLGSFHDPSVIFEQLSVLYMFPRDHGKSGHRGPDCYCQGGPDGYCQDNKAILEGHMATAKTLASMMSAIPLTARGPVQICIFDIHALQERFYFSDNIIPRLESAIPMLLETIIGLPDKDKIAVAFPDDGAFKRFHQFFPDYDTVTCVKIRDGNTRIVKVKDGENQGRKQEDCHGQGRVAVLAGNPEGKHVVIVDDLVQTGGTLINCGKALVDKGATDVSAYATHAVFPNDSWKKFTDNDDFKFKNFWITDSIPHAVEISKHEPFKLLSLCESISRMLMVYDLKQET